MHVFLTGPIQAGKSTVINKTVANLPPELLAGFRTVSLASQLPQALAETYIVPAWEAAPALNRDRLIGIRWGEGLYTPFAGAFDSGGLAILGAKRQANLLLMDELGFMESQAPRFCQAVLSLLDQDTPILGVVKPRSTPLLDSVRQHPGVKVLTVNENNRDQLPRLIRELLILQPAQPRP